MQILVKKRAERSSFEAFSHPASRGGGMVQEQSFQTI
jgi:hypothetical protein